MQCEILTFLYYVKMNTILWMSIRLTNGRICTLCMAVERVVGGLRAPAMKRSHGDAIQTIKYLLLLTVDLEGLENLSLLVSALNK
jgi:hypothetical protein